LKINKRMRKGLSMVLAIIMVFSIIPFSVGVAAQAMPLPTVPNGVVSNIPGMSNGTGSRDYVNAGMMQWIPGTAEFPGPICSSRNQMFIDQTTDDNLTNSNNPIHVNNIRQINMSPGLQITRPIAHFSITSQATGQSITSVGRRQILGDKTAIAAGQSNAVIDLREEHLILTVEVGDTIIFADHSIHSSAFDTQLRQPPVGTMVANESNSTTTLRKTFEFQAQGGITTQQLPFPGGFNGSWMPQGTSMVVTADMVGYTTFFYRVSDWHTPEGNWGAGTRGIFNPLAWGGRGGRNAGAENGSQNGNYWVHAYHQTPGLFVGGIITYFQALAIRVIEPQDDYSEIVVYKREMSNGIGNNQLLAGATFRIQGYYPERLPGEPPVPIDRIATTGADGRVIFSNLPPGHFTVTEVQPPTGYLLGENNVWAVHLERNQTVELGTAQSHTFFNVPKSTLEVSKLCGVTNQKLPGAVFELRDPTTGETWQTTTGNDGRALFGRGNNGNFLYPDRTYILREVVAPNGFILNPESREIVLSPGDRNLITIQNWPFPGLTIEKSDSVTGAPIQGAEFTVERLSPAPGMITGNPFRSDAQGRIMLPDLPAGVYRIIETRAANNYWLDPQLTNRTWTITLREGEDYLLQVENTLLPTLVITKMNAMTNMSVPLTHFRIEYEVPNSSSVQLVGNFVTDSNGQIILPFVDVGWYRITETRAAPGMALSTNNNHRVFLNPGDNTYRLLDTINSQDSSAPQQSTPQPPDDSTPNNSDTAPVSDLPDDDMSDGEITIDLTGNLQVTDGDAHLTGENIWNWPLNSIVIKKADATTGQLLQGATFELIHVSSGESGTRGTVIGRFTTNHSGIIVITGLQPGTYVVEEVVPPPNYTLSVNNSQHVNLRPDGFSIVEVEFSNHPYGGLLITKRCESTGRPLQNAEFRVTNSDGAVVGTANGLFRTNQQGEIFIPNLSPGSYIITEIAAPSGFELNSTPQTIHINASGQIYSVEFTNRPLGGLQIVKLNSITREPISGAEFAVSKINGERIGTFRTNNYGIINVSGLEPGWYTVVETRAADGFFLDSEPRNIEVVFGAMATLEVLNTPMSGIRVRKIDAITRAPIFGVEFMLFDLNNRVVERFTTDNNGVIDFFGIEPGRYTIRETRAAPGYYLDEMPRTVEFVQGRFTEIVWENTPQMGQIQIIKLSGDDNQINGLPAGTPLAGAVFEVSDFRTGNVLDRFVSGSDGRAVSRPLPLGRYIVREVQAPQWYMLSSQVLDIVIEFPTQIIRHNFLNYSANTGVIIRKTGNQETMPGDSISYTIREIRNTSTVPLTDFYWRDVLPTDAVRLTRIVTGTYNQALQYRVIATTNRGETITLADNLSTIRNNVIDTNPVALGLRNDEFITSFTFLFGTVQAGFTLVEQPQVFVNVLQNIPNGYQFANRVDVGGKYDNEWVIGNSAWVTTIFAKTSPLPRTGW